MRAVAKLRFRILPSQTYRFSWSQYKYVTLRKREAWTGKQKNKAGLRNIFGKEYKVLFLVHRTNWKQTKKKHTTFLKLLSEKPWAWLKKPVIVKLHWGLKLTRIGWVMWLYYPQELHPPQCPLQMGPQRNVVKEAASITSRTEACLTGSHHWYGPVPCEVFSSFLYQMGTFIVAF